MTKEKQLKLRVSEYLYNLLEETAKLKQMTKSELVRQILLTELDKENNLYV